MKVSQHVHGTANGNGVEGAQLAFIFGSTAELAKRESFDAIRRQYPEAILLGCSTAGEICGTSVLDDTLVVTAVQFENTPLQLARTSVSDMADSQAAGEFLARNLPHEGLRHVFVLSDGLKVNGTALSEGLKGALPDDVVVTGGLSGDGDRFSRTLVCADDVPAEGTVAALGLYGDSLQVGFGSLGGWDPFGPDRLITRSKGNVLYELDNQSALELYKTYLGPHAAGLPSTGLLFPLELRTGDQGLVRTILAVDEKEQSLTFAGDVPEGCYARLMKANFERLIDGAVGAAKASHHTLSGGSADLAVLISCVGRKLVLKQRIEEEVEGVREVLGEGTTLAGFYSYGEISPQTPTAKCELHNQTMTITTFGER
ncbi:MAG TPA: FIST N-terminal domain-containing protein [Chloroflexota bacterium]|nr:FIST N-terminal domain-containing protein [Chloroflexota bacterium]